jgi:signal transduction histidine kinase
MSGMESLLPPLLLGGGVITASALISLSAYLDRRQMEGHLRQVERDLDARGRYLGLLAQEMQGHGLALLGYATAPRAVEQAPEGLEGRARALLGLSADVSDLLASNAGPRVLKEGETPLGPVLDEAIGQIAQSLVPGRRHWAVAGELRGLTLAADRRALLGALRQVLTRAVRHTRDGDAVQLRLVRADTNVAIIVEDEGTGQMAEDLNGMSVGGGTRGRGRGRGGARGRMRAHGGDLTLEAVPGIGARAWLTLPRERVVQPAA